MAAYAQIVDVLFAGSKFPIGVEPSRKPIGVAGSVHFDPKELTPEKVEEATGGQAKLPKSATVARPDILKLSARMPTS